MLSNVRKRLWNRILKPHFFGIPKTLRVCGGHVMQKVAHLASKFFLGYVILQFWLSTYSFQTWRKREEEPTTWSRFSACLRIVITSQDVVYVHTSTLFSALSVNWSLTEIAKFGAKLTPAVTVWSPEAIWWDNSSLKTRICSRMTKLAYDFRNDGKFENILSLSLFLLWNTF